MCNCADNGMKLLVVFRNEEENLVMARVLSSYDINGIINN